MSLLLLAACALTNLAWAEPPPIANLVVGAANGTAMAHSERTSRFGIYGLGQLFDGDPDTAWIQGSPTEESPWVEVVFDSPVTLDGFLLHPGAAESDDALTQDAVARRVAWDLDGARLNEVVLPLSLTRRADSASCVPEPGVGNRTPRIVLFHTPLTMTRIRLTVSRSLPGTQSTALALAEWQFLEKDAPPRGVDADTAFAIELLRMLRKGKLHKPWPHENLVISTAQIEAVSDTEGSWSVPTLPLAVGDPAAATGGVASWIRERRPSLYDTAVTIDAGDHGVDLIGNPSFVRGSDHWIEVYPTVRTDRKGWVTLLEDRVQTGGARDCRGAVHTPE